MPTNIKYTLSISACALTLALGAIPASAISSALELVATQDATEYKIVKSNNTQLRCGDQDVFYAIAELNANTPLQVVGASGTYTKVRMPESIGAFVPANEVDASPNAKTVTLTVDSKLRAPSHLLGLSGSWKALYADSLKSGTVLSVLETLVSDAGDTLGYRVSPPKSHTGELAIAYIKTDSLRDPKVGEVANYDPASGQPVKPEPVADPIAEPAAEPITEPITEEAIEESAQEVDTSMIEEMDMPSDEPVEITNSAPVDVNEPLDTPEPTRTAPSGLVSASALEDLQATFDDARSLPKSDLDESLDELQAEFSRTRVQAEDGSSLAAALDQRLEWIDIRIQTRDQRRSIAAILASYDANADQMAQDIKAWQAGRAYQLVGHMTTSAVYTGERLPLLYRIQAIDPSSGATRTIGYVAPTAAQDFRHLLGRVVGIVGAMNNDDALNLTIIVPDRIDPMPE